MADALGLLGASSGTGVFHHEFGVNARKGAPWTAGAGFHGRSGTFSDFCTQPLAIRHSARTAAGAATRLRRRPDGAITGPPARKRGTEERHRGVGSTSPPGRRFPHWPVVVLA